MIKNSAKITEINQINENLYQIKVSKSIYEFNTNTLLGVQILSMSKRIMNEVMTTAEDLNIKIFYQDTDSMHIEKARLNDLSEEFKKRYNRELIGKNLGQFHNDFDELTGEVWAHNSIFCGKKCYIDMLMNDKGEYAVHNRAKDVSLNTIDKVAKDKYKDKYIDKDEYKNNESKFLNQAKYDLYKDLYNEIKIDFDMLSTQARFKNNKNRQISNCPKFTRGLLFKGIKNEM